MAGAKGKGKSNYQGMKRINEIWRKTNRKQMSNKGWSSKVKDMSQGQVLERQELEKLEKLDERAKSDDDDI